MGKRLTLALSMAVLGAAVFPIPSQAQRGFLTGQGAAMRGRSHVPFRGGHQGAYLTGQRGHRYPRRSGYGALPYLYPSYYYSDYFSEPDVSESQPTRVVVENSKLPAETPPPPPPESLVLELQGNHWVRITDSGRTVVNSEPEQKGSSKTSNLRTMTPEQGGVMEPPRELPPAVLVFRDGHKEEITRYTIVGGTIYTSSDYWNNGSWTRKVPIAELDVPTTLELNRERGANFSLPSSPGVVVIRP
jgi:hypothetical protein